MNSRDPDNWNAIASQVKAEAKGLCQRCGWVCDGSLRDRFLQVHHWDMKPENNKRLNLVALCPRCHLELHQGGRGNVSEGQMGLLGEI
jgi:predicted HNH restriction endonuclease